MAAILAQTKRFSVSPPKSAKSKFNLFYFYFNFIGSCVISFYLIYFSLIMFISIHYVYSILP